MLCVTRHNTGMVSDLERSAGVKEPEHEKNVDFSGLTRRRLSHTEYFLGRNVESEFWGI